MADELIGMRAELAQTRVTGDRRRRGPQEADRLRPPGLTLADVATVAGAGRRGRNRGRAGQERDR